MASCEENKGDPSRLGGARASLCAAAEVGGLVLLGASKHWP